MESGWDYVDSSLTRGRGRGQRSEAETGFETETLFSWKNLNFYIAYAREGEKGKSEL